MQIQAFRHIVMEYCLVCTSGSEPPYCLLSSPFTLSDLTMRVRMSQEGKKRHRIPECDRRGPLRGACIVLYSALAQYGDYARQRIRSSNASLASIGPC